MQLEVLPGLGTTAKLLRFKVCFLPNRNEMEQLTTMPRSDNPLYSSLLNV